MWKYCILEIQSRLESTAAAVVTQYGQAANRATLTENYFECRLSRSQTEQDSVAVGREAERGGFNWISHVPD